MFAVKKHSSQEEETRHLRALKEKLSVKLSRPQTNKQTNMSEEDALTLKELLDLSIGTPQAGTVNFSALHALLLAVLRRLGLRDVKVRWRASPPGDAASPLQVDEDEEEDVEPEPQSGSELQERTGGQSELCSRLQSCEDGVSELMKLIPDNLKDEIKELHHQHSMLVAETETAVAAVETCRHSVDDLKTLRDVDTSVFVTWDVMQSSLLGHRGHLDEDLDEEVVDEASEIRPTHTRLHSTSDRHHPSSETWPHQKTDPGPGPVAAGVLQRYSETLEALTNVGKLREKFSGLETRVSALEDGKVDETQLQTQLSPLREDRRASVNHFTVEGFQDLNKNLMDQLNQQKVLMGGVMSDHQRTVDDVQQTIVQLQDECEKLQDSMRRLYEDSGQKQRHIEEMYQTMQQLDERKADKHMVETEIKADKCALDGKVSRRQFDSATEQLTDMFHELLSKVTGQEQNWHKVVHQLSTEMECKLNRIELDSVKKQLEDRWKNIHEKLRKQEAPEHDDAAAIRKRLVDRFHCLSCDRPVVKHTPGPHLVALPSTPGFPSHRSMRPFTVYALEQFRHNNRSDHVPELPDYCHLVVSRSCGGSHTVTSANQRRSGVQSTKSHALPDVDVLIPSEEVDIIGLDGHIYRGRLNAPSIRNTETKLPTIFTKDGSRIKHKSRGFTSNRAAASSPETHNSRSV
nr:uncharacterized protein C16orf96 homolog isoform X2 [Solea senegalensis]